MEDEVRRIPAGRTALASAVLLGITGAVFMLSNQAIGQVVGLAMMLAVAPCTLYRRRTRIEIDAESLRIYRWRTEPAKVMPWPKIKAVHFVPPSGENSAVFAFNINGTSEYLSFDSERTASAVLDAIRPIAQDKLLVSRKDWA